MFWTIAFAVFVAVFVLPALVGAGFIASDFAYGLLARRRYARLCRAIDHRPMATRVPEPAAPSFFDTLTGAILVVVVAASFVTLVSVWA